MTKILLRYIYISNSVLKTWMTYHFFWRLAKPCKRRLLNRVSEQTLQNTKPYIITLLTEIKTRKTCFWTTDINHSDSITIIKTFINSWNRQFITFTHFAVKRFWKKFNKDWIIIKNVYFISNVSENLLHLSRFCTKNYTCVYAIMFA